MQRGNSQGTFGSSGKLWRSELNPGTKRNRTELKEIRSEHSTLKTCHFQHVCGSNFEIRHQHVLWYHLNTHKDIQSEIWFHKMMADMNAQSSWDRFIKKNPARFASSNRSYFEILNCWMLSNLAPTDVWRMSRMLVAVCQASDIFCFGQHREPRTWD